MSDAGGKEKEAVREAVEAEKEAVEVCCANCGIAQVDDIKLKICDGGCDLVKYCSDRCQGNLGSSTRRIVKSGRLNCMAKNYLSSLMKVISESVRSASCRCRLIWKNLRSNHAAVKWCDLAVIMPITKAVGEVDVHFVESQL